MRKFMSYVLFTGMLALVLTFSSCKQAAEINNQPRIEHYRFLQFSETPFDLEKGIRPLTAEEAASVNNYAFTYDDEGRLTEVKYCRGEELLSYGSLGGAARITYTYGDHEQVKYSFNADGDTIETSGKVFKSVYALDDNGVRTGLKFYDREGNPVENRNKIHSYDWEVLEDGIVKENRYTLAGEETVLNEFCPFYELRFTYDEKGLCTKMVNYQADTMYNCTAENCGDIGVCYFEFHYNENGDLLHFSVHNTVGQLSNLYWGWAKRLNTVDENGYVIETAIYDQDDEYLSGMNVPVLKYVVDEHGAVTEVWNLNAERQLINHPRTGVAITRYVYDDRGHRTETLRLDKDGNPVETENG